MAETINEEEVSEGLEETEGTEAVAPASKPEPVAKRGQGELLAEVVCRFEEPEDCSALLYAPLDKKLTYRKTHRYGLVYEGSKTKLESFIEDTLLDPVSQDLVLGGRPALDGALFHLDYGMKKGVLDLEKETILRYYRELDGTDFDIVELELSTRIYVFGDASEGGSSVSDIFVRDIVNPAIHRWDVDDA